MIISFLFSIFFIFNHKSYHILFSKKIRLIQRELGCLKFIHRSRNIIHSFFLIENLIEKIKSKIKIFLNMIFKTVIKTLKKIFLTFFYIFKLIFSFLAAFF